MISSKSYKEVLHSSIRIAGKHICREINMHVYSSYVISHTLTLFALMSYVHVWTVGLKRR